MKILLLWCIVLAMTINFTLASDVPPLYSSVKEWTSSKNTNKFGIVKDYVHYKLYFTDSEQKQTCLPDAESSLLNNATASLFAEAIDMCSIPKYSPRILSSTQVSFKRNDQQYSSNNSGNGNQTVPFNHSTTGPPVLSEEETEAAATETANISASANDIDVEDDDKNDIIHEYLAIALVLPHHPFSRALINSIRIVAPMYPSVTVYFGIATEFQSLCNQYGVRSYPKLLLFHKGLLVDKHANVNGEKYKPAKLAKRFSRWTNKLPRTNPVLPLPFRSQEGSGSKRTGAVVHREQNEIEQGMMTPLALQNITFLVNVIQEWCAHTVTSVTHTDISQLLWNPFHNTTSTNTTIITNVISSSSNLDFGESIEPVVSFSDEAKAWDIPVYLLSSVYVMMRLLNYMVTLFSTYWNTKQASTSQ